MNKQKFIECLRDPSKIKDNEIAELDQLIREYPYFQGARALSAKIAKERKQKDLNVKIASAAVYATDRILLKRFVNDHLFFIDTKEEVKAREEARAAAAKVAPPKAQPSTKQAPVGGKTTEKRPTTGPKPGTGKPARPSSEGVDKAKNLDQAKQPVLKPKTPPVESEPVQDFNLDELIEEIYADIEDLKKSKARFLEIEKKIEEEEKIKEKLEDQVKVEEEEKIEEGKVEEKGKAEETSIEEATTVEEDEKEFLDAVSAAIEKASGSTSPASPEQPKDKAPEEKSGVAEKRAKAIAASEEKAVEDKTAAKVEKPEPEPAKPAEDTEGKADSEEKPKSSTGASKTKKTTTKKTKSVAKAEEDTTEESTKKTTKKKEPQKKKTGASAKTAATKTKKASTKAKTEPTESEKPKASRKASAKALPKKQEQDVSKTKKQVQELEELADKDPKEAEKFAIENNFPLNAEPAAEQAEDDQSKGSKKADNKEEAKTEEPDSNTLKVVRRKSGKVQSTTYETRKTESEEKKIIDEFITKSPSISKPSKDDLEEKKEDLSDKSTRFQADIASEYLAEIYAEQGKMDKAISIYEKLSLKFPEKKSFFASRIAELQSKKD